MKTKERIDAIRLRKGGFTYKEIIAQLPVSKGSLSYWLRGIELTGDQKARIYGKNIDIRKKFIEYNAIKSKKLLQEKEDIFKIAADGIDKISSRELMLAGIALYWAEGYKAESANYIEFTNSDATMIKFMMKWFREIFDVPEHKFKIRIQIHNKDEVENAVDFWSSVTGVPKEQFTKPYVRISPTSHKKTYNRLKFGVCHIRISDNKLLTKIKGMINGLSGAIV